MTAHGTLVATIVTEYGNIKIVDLPTYMSEVIGAGGESNSHHIDYDIAAVAFQRRHLGERFDGDEALNEALIDEILMEDGDWWVPGPAVEV